MRSLRSPSRRRWLRLAGVLLVFFGIVLLGSSIAYFVYGFKARSDLENLAYTPSTSWTADGTPELGELARLRGDNPNEANGNSTEVIPRWAIWDQAAYPGEPMGARYWSQPLAYEPRWSLSAALIEGFQPLDPEDAPERGSLPTATRIVIPSIDVDSTVEELSIIDLGDSRAYKTPKHLVGHIPETANAGERGTAWFFGHLESPIRGEGSIFRDLPQIPEMLQNGEDVYTILESEEGSYLYKLVGSEVLSEDDIRLYDLQEASVKLVTCVPALYYDHRLVIWGELVGVRQ